MSITMADFMNDSLKLRAALESLYYGEIYLAGYIRCKNALDKVDHRAQKNETFRAEFYNWMNNKAGYSTVKLRELFKEVGLDYWGSLDDGNVIDTFDSLGITFKK